MYNLTQVFADHLYILLTKVCDVCKGMKTGKNEDHPSDKLVKFDNVIQWKQKVDSC